MMLTENLNARWDGPAELFIQIKSDWLLICVTFVTKTSGWNAESFTYEIGLQLLPVPHNP